MNDFALAPVSLAREEGSGGSRSAVEFCDFIVDGKSLREALGAADIGVLSNMWPSRNFASQLLCEELEPLLEGRSHVYGCRECLDIWCGGYAVQVTLEGDRIFWSEVARFDMDYSTISADGETVLEEMAFTPTGVGPFEFAAAQYRSAIEPFLSSRA